MNRVYRAQVALLLRCLPEVEREECFALKGGTAINLFVRNMPRLSVDIDLTYLPLEPRNVALPNLAAALERIATRIERSIPDAVVDKRSSSDVSVARLNVRTTEAVIKIEPNVVLRGTVFPAGDADLCIAAQEEFALFTSARVLATADLYAGKLCAALDRQHPRDLFDVKLLLENEGLTGPIRQAFVVYLASHNRPMHELLAPNFQDLSPIYEQQFVSMVKDAPSKEDLEAVREEMVRRLRAELSDRERMFLLSVKRGKPDWDALNVEGIEHLPGLQWKLRNIEHMEAAKHSAMLSSLERVLGVSEWVPRTEIGNARTKSAW